MKLNLRFVAVFLFFVFSSASWSADTFWNNLSALDEVDVDMPSSSTIDRVELLSDFGSDFGSDFDIGLTTESDEQNSLKSDSDVDMKDDAAAGDESNDETDFADETSEDDEFSDESSMSEDVKPKKIREEEKEQRRLHALLICFYKDQIMNLVPGEKKIIFTAPSLNTVAQYVGKILEKNISTDGFIISMRSVFHIFTKIDGTVVFEAKSEKESDRIQRMMNEIVAEAQGSTSMTVDSSNKKRVAGGNSNRAGSYESESERRRKKKRIN